MFELTVITGPAPTVTVATTNTMLCSGQSTTLTANGATTYTWNTGATTQSINFIPPATVTYTVTGSNALGCQGAKIFTQTALLCTGIQQLGILNSNISVFPNPFSHQTTLKFQLNENANVQIELFNSLGQKISTIENKYLSNGDYEYKIISESKGIYFLRTVINDVASTQKLIQID